MKIVCEKDKILKALNSVTKAVAVRTTMPILGIEYIINDCKVEEQGATVVNAIMFTEIIRRLPDTEIKIEVNDKNLLVIECEGSLYKLATMNPDEFPELPKISVENSIEIEQNILKDMIRKTIFAVSTEENRPIFTGCLFEIANNKLNVVAVDGFRLAWKSKFLQAKVNNFCVETGRTISSSPIEKENKYPLRVSVDIGKVTISCTNQTGDAKEEIYLNTEGKNLEAGFNPKYFLDALRNIDDEEIFVNFGTSISPCIIRPFDDD